MSWAEVTMGAVIAFAVVANVWAIAWCRVRIEQAAMSQPVHLHCHDCDGPGDDPDNPDVDPVDLDRYGIDRDWAPQQRSDL